MFEAAIVYARSTIKRKWIEESAKSKQLPVITRPVSRQLDPYKSRRIALTSDEFSKIDLILLWRLSSLITCASNP